MAAIWWALIVGIFVGIAIGILITGLCSMAGRRSTLLKYDRDRYAHVAGQGVRLKGEGW